MNRQQYAYDFPHPALATDCAVFGFDGQCIKILLVKRGIEPFKGLWALPGGFLRMNETTEECIRRELHEETSLSPEVIEHFGVFSALDRDPRERVVSLAYYSLVKQSEVVGGDDASDARWFALGALPTLAFDHKEILDKALQTLREKIHFEPIGFDLMDRQFTIPDLQRLYESILGVIFDRRNFMKKILMSGVISECKDVEVAPSPTRHAGRNPKFYTFNKEAYDQMKGNGKFKMEF
ncbi:MAG: NUDIX hydrolase [Bacteroidales bacterium]|nr:NUDIX hydrolase [Bacteroidales bacterium]